MTLIICVAFVAMCVFFLNYQRIKHSHGMGLQIAVKCAATAMAVWVGLLGCAKSGTGAHWVLLAGLAACAVADGVICVHFVAGGAIFALGHILYMVAFCLMRGPDWRSAAIFLCLMWLAAGGFMHFRARLGKAAPLGFAYAAVLSLMVALSAVQKPLFFAGALLFAVSDGLLGVLLMNRGHAGLDYSSLAAYYLGQFLLGLALCV